MPLDSLSRVNFVVQRDNKHVNMGIFEGTLRFGNLVQGNFVLKFMKISMV